MFKKLFFILSCFVGMAHSSSAEDKINIEGISKPRLIQALVNNAGVVGAGQYHPNAKKLMTLQDAKNILEDYENYESNGITPQGGRYILDYIWGRYIKVHLMLDNITKKFIITNYSRYEKYSKKTVVQIVSELIGEANR